jgi:hypothetical protein
MLHTFVVQKLYSICTETDGETTQMPANPKILIYIGRRVAKLAARLLATTALWVRIQTYLKNTKCET